MVSRRCRAKRNLSNEFVLNKDYLMLIVVSIKLFRVLDYFGYFDNLEKVLGFLIDSETY